MPKDNKELIAEAIARGIIPARSAQEKDFLIAHLKKEIERKPRIWGPTHIYCSICESIQPAQFEPLTATSVDGKFVGGDIVCTCGAIAATAYRPIK